MILGFNQDVRYKGKTYHIQTEDSGPEPPVVHTHIFVGGSIVNSRRLEYGDAVGRSDLEEHVRGLMRAQHREVHEALVSGELDEVLRSNRPKLRGDIPLARERNTPTPALASAAKAEAEPQKAETPPPEEDPTRTMVMPALDLGAIEAEARRLLLGKFEDVLSSVLVDAPPVSPAGPARSMEQGPLPQSLLEASEAGNNPEFPTPTPSAHPLMGMILAYFAEDLDEP